MVLLDGQADRRTDEGGEMDVTAKEKHRKKIIDKLRQGANVHEAMARLCGRDESAEGYHLDIAQVMREAALMLEGED